MCDEGMLPGESGAVVGDEISTALDGPGGVGNGDGHGDGDVARSGGRPAGGASGHCAAGHDPGSESGERVREGGSGALPEKYGGGGRSHAGGEIQLQAFAGDEFVRAPGDAHRAVQQYLLREDFRAGGAGGEDCGVGSQGQACGDDEGFVCVLLDSAGERGRFETGRATHAVWQSPDLAGRGAGSARWKLDRPLCDGSDLFAVEWDFAAHGAAAETIGRWSSWPGRAGARVDDRNYTSRVEDVAASNSR